MHPYEQRQVDTEKNFHTRRLIGEKIIVVTKHDEKIIGTMVEYFESNHALVLKDCEIEKVDKTKEKKELVLVKGDCWAMIQVEKFREISYDGRNKDG